MSLREKANIAWTLVKEENPRDSIRIIQGLTGVAKGTVDNMRAKWRELNDDGKHGSRESLMSMSWAEGRRKAKGSDYDNDVEAWREAEATKIVDKLHRAKLIGDLTRNPDITAIVLMKINEHLPTALMAQWAIQSNGEIPAALMAEWAAAQEEDREQRPFKPHEGPGDGMAF